MAHDPFAEFDEAEVLAEPETPPTEEATPAPEPEPEAAPAEDQPPAEEVAAVEPEPEKDPVPYDRFEEINQRAHKAEEQRDELMKMMLASGQTPQGTPQPQPEPVTEAPKIDPDVAALINPILDQRLQQFDGMDKLLHEKRQEDDMTELEGMMPGFRDYWPKIQEEFNKMPDEAKAQFDSKAGALALAGIIRQRESEQPEARAAKTLSNRAVNEGRPGAPVGSVKVTPNDIANMSGEDFEKYLARQKSANSPDTPGIDALLL